MKLTKTLRTTALAASLATVLGLALTPTPAAADTVTGNTIFKVILQPTTLLYYYSEIDLTIPSSALVTLAGGVPAALGAQALTGAASGTAVTANAAISPGAAPSLNNVTLTMNNVWAVRSITTPGTGKTTVSVSFASGTATPTATLTGATSGSTAKILLSNLANSPTSFPGTGFGSAQSGNVSMTMDLSNASTADTYQGATIYITATST